MDNTAVFDEFFNEDPTSDLMLMMFVMAFLTDEAVVDERNPSVFDQRLAWANCCDKHVQRGTFERRLRMKKESFDILLSFVHGCLAVNEMIASLRGGIIVPELCLHCTLRWLAGGSYLDMCDIAGISRSSFCRVVWRTITAIVLAPQLEMRFPTTSEAVTKAVAGFSKISTECVINNCVSVIDGYLLRTTTPPKRCVSNVKSFFSGHCQCYGVNVQGAADHHSRFTFFAVAAPGVTNDRDAIRQCALFDLIGALPRGICVIGDAAYEASENLVPIYQGVDKLIAKYDNFNFFASQLRIRIEMAFGLMQMKWGILQRPLTVSLYNLKWMAQAIARLHNFVINERLRFKGVDDSETNMQRRTERGGVSYHPTVPHDENGNPINLDDVWRGVVEGHSHLREEMADRVKAAQLRRPPRRKKNATADDDGGGSDEDLEQQITTLAAFFFI